LLGQRLPTDQVGASSGQAALVITEITKQVLGDDEPQDRVSQELKAFVVVGGRMLVVRPGAMSERPFQQREIVESITDSILQRGRRSEPVHGVNFA
jgi:hypothetical protein